MIPVRVSFWYEFIPVLTYRSVFVYMIPVENSYQYNSYRFEFIPVLTYRSVFVYMIPVKNLIPVQLVPVRDFTCKHPLIRAVSMKELGLNTARTHQIGCPIGFCTSCKHFFRAF